MNDTITLDIIILLSLGVLAQWLGWKLKLPPILVLLSVGLLVGPGLNYFNPGELLGESLFPIVSIAVSIILFEGGLTLKLADLKFGGKVIFRLVSVGVAITCCATALAAHYILGFTLEESFLYGGLLSVTGPTVIGPMLRTIRPNGNITKIAKWEGILNDPAGVLIAVFVYEVITIGGIHDAPQAILLAFCKVLIVGGGLAFLGAGVTILLVRQRLLPEFLHNIFLLVLVIGSFFFANYFQEESGLVTVTLLGVLLANQKIFLVDHILLFKENLRVLFISCLFIILSAQTNFSTLEVLGFPSVLFLLILILLIRPLSVLGSTLLSTTPWRERFLLMMLAPRGIVALSLTSVFAMKLSDKGYPHGEEMLAVTMLVVLGTIIFYGFGAGWVATQLGLAERDPQGILFIGAHLWARQLAKLLQDNGVKTLLVDNNHFNIEQANKSSLEAYCGNVLSKETLENLDLSRIRHAVCITANHQVNAFAPKNLIEYLERADVYSISPEINSNSNFEYAIPLNPLFGKEVTYTNIHERVTKGSLFNCLSLGDKPDLTNQSVLENTVNTPLFLINQLGKVSVFSEMDSPSLTSNSKVIYLKDP